MDVKRWALAGLVAVLVALMVVGPFVPLAWADEAPAFLEGSPAGRRPSTGRRIVERDTRAEMRGFGREAAASWG